MIDTEDSNLVQHAKRELAMAGVDEELRPSIIAAVSAVSSYEGHSGSSHFFVVNILHDLLRFKNITALTNDPAEWMKVGEAISVGEDLWQNVRNGEAFSKDGGLTYYVLSEQRKWVHRLLPWSVWRRIPHSIREVILYPSHTSRPAVKR